MYNNLINYFIFSNLFQTTNILCSIVLKARVILFGQQGVKSTSVLNYPSVLNMSRGSQKFIERETLGTRDFNILLERCFKDDLIVNYMRHTIARSCIEPLFQQSASSFWLRICFARSNPDSAAASKPGLRCEQKSPP